MWLKKELSSLQHYTKEIENELIRNRVSYLMEWYVRKCTYYKNIYYSLSVLLIVINASIPILNQTVWKYSKITVSIISSLATISTSVMTLFTMKDTWFRYRNSVELMKKECMLFSGRCNEYSRHYRETLFIKRFEDIIENERKTWQKNKFYNDQK